MEDLLDLIVLLKEKDQLEDLEEIEEDSELVEEDLELMATQLLT